MSQAGFHGGRVTKAPAASAGGSELTAEYYSNDLARSFTQAGETTKVAHPVRSRP